MDWKKNMKEKFSDIMLNYNLRYHIISNNSIALIGRGFALMLMVHFDNLYVDYVMRNQEKQLVSYYIFSYIANQFDAVDRKGIGNPKNVSERLEAIFTIWSRGLPRHCDSLLKGEHEWIEDYKQFELATGLKNIKPEIALELSEYL
ncbi:hypothetical protein AALA13_11525 [Lachnospiraceae bacterium 50-23]